MNIDFWVPHAYRFSMIFEDENSAARHSRDFPRNLDNASVEELQDYIAELNEEITRVKADIEKKKASAVAADSIFK